MSSVSLAASLTPSCAIDDVPMHANDKSPVAAPADYCQLPEWVVARMFARALYSSKDPAPLAGLLNKGFVAGKPSHDDDSLDVLDRLIEGA